MRLVGQSQKRMCSSSRLFLFLFIYFKFFLFTFNSSFQMMRCAHYLPCLATMYSSFISFLFRLLSILVCLVFLETCHCQILYSCILCLVNLGHFLSISLKTAIKQVFGRMDWLCTLCLFILYCLVQRFIYVSDSFLFTFVA